jgi:hypothetical protein
VSNEQVIQRLLALREQYILEGNNRLAFETDARLRVLGHYRTLAAAKPEQIEVAAVEPQAEVAVRKRAPKRSA